ncbi:hypothetical protein BB560_000386 [Smittium megazygosporum]|uniref:Zinc finger PHD-type domain-containing protein n=1 Tax=Smittium megazygosporum TaxID=133381 RepID=A0A2T9ZKH7_9FUNG|nr:hypothetical protein BB560_000386 [Smittium megazygosporum]
MNQQNTQPSIQESLISEDDPNPEISPEYMIQLKIQSTLDDKHSKKKPKPKPKKSKRSFSSKTIQKPSNIFCQVCGNVAEKEISVICSECNELFHESCVNVTNYQLGLDFLFSCQSCVLQFPKRHRIPGTYIMGGKQITPRSQKISKKGTKQTYTRKLNKPPKSSKKITPPWISDSGFDNAFSTPIAHNQQGKLISKIDPDIGLEECPVCEQECTCGFAVSIPETNVQITPAIAQELPLPFPANLSTALKTEPQEDQEKCVYSDIPIQTQSHTCSSTIIKVVSEPNMNLEKGFEQGFKIENNSQFASTKSPESVDLKIQNDLHHTQLQSSKPEFVTDDPISVDYDFDAQINKPSILINVNKDTPIKQLPALVLISSPHQEVEELDLSTSPNTQHSLKCESSTLNTINSSKNSITNTTNSNSVQLSEYQNQGMWFEGSMHNAQGLKIANNDVSPTSVSPNSEKGHHSDKTISKQSPDKSENLSSNFLSKAAPQEGLELNISNIKQVGTILKMPRRRGRPAKNSKINKGMGDSLNSFISNKGGFSSSHKKHSNKHKFKNSKKYDKNNRSVDFEDEIINVTDVSTDNDDFERYQKSIFATAHNPSSDLPKNKKVGGKDLSSELSSDYSMDSDIRVEEESYLADNVSDSSSVEPDVDDYDKIKTSGNNFFIKNRKLLLENERKNHQAVKRIEKDKKAIVDPMETQFTEDSASADPVNEELDHVSSSEDVFQMIVRHHEFGYEISEASSDSEPENYMGDHSKVGTNSGYNSDSSSNEWIVDHEGVFTEDSDEDSSEYEYLSDQPDELFLQSRLKKDHSKNNNNQAISPEHPSNTPDSTKDTSPDSDREEALLQMHLDQIHAVWETGANSNIRNSLFLDDDHELYESSALEHSSAIDGSSYSSNYHSDSSLNFSQIKDLPSNSLGNLNATTNSKALKTTSNIGTKKIYEETIIYEDPGILDSNDSKQKNDKKEANLDFDFDFNDVHTDDEFIFTHESELEAGSDLDDIAGGIGDTEFPADPYLLDDLSIDEASLAMGLALSMEQSQIVAGNSKEPIIPGIQSLVKQAAGIKGEQDDPIDGMISVNMLPGIGSSSNKDWPILTVKNDVSEQARSSAFEQLVHQLPDLQDSSHVIPGKADISLNDNFLEKSILLSGNSNTQGTTGKINSVFSISPKLDPLDTDFENSIYVKTRKAIGQLSISDNHSHEIAIHSQQDSSNEPENTSYDTALLHDPELIKGSNTDFISKIVNNYNMPQRTTDQNIDFNMETKNDWDKEIETLVDTSALTESPNRNFKGSAGEKGSVSLNEVEDHKALNFIKNDFERFIQTLEPNNKNDKINANENPESYNSSVERQIQRFDKIPINIFRQSRYLASHKKSNQFYLHQLKDNFKSFIKGNSPSPFRKRVLKSKLHNSRSSRYQNSAAQVSKSVSLEEDQTTYNCNNSVSTKESGYLSDKMVQMSSNNGHGSNKLAKSSVFQVNSCRSSKRKPMLFEKESNSLQPTSLNSKFRYSQTPQNSKKVKTSLKNSFQQAIFDKWNTFSKHNLNLPSKFANDQKNNQLKLNENGTNEHGMPEHSSEDVHFNSEIDSFEPGFGFFSQDSFLDNNKISFENQKLTRYTRDHSYYKEANGFSNTSPNEFNSLSPSPINARFGLESGFELGFSATQENLDFPMSSTAPPRSPGLI